MLQKRLRKIVDDALSGKTRKKKKRPEGKLEKAMSVSKNIQALTSIEKEFKVKRSEAVKLFNQGVR